MKVSRSQLVLRWASYLNPFFYLGLIEPGPVSSPAVFSNPVVRLGADPWIVYHAGDYYFTSTAGNRIEVRKSPTLAGLHNARPTTIWKAPYRGPNSRDIWAPEFHWLGDRWIIYYTATSSDLSDANRRIFVLESETPDLLGPLRERGPLQTPLEEDCYAIDGTLFQAGDGKFYYFWSGREQSQGGPQNIYVASMSNPWTISGKRVRLSTPEFDWEKHGWDVNEGPQILQKDGRLFVVYSASGFTTTNYCLGLLTHQGGDILQSSNWTKSPNPVFQAVQTPAGQVLGPGHNSFFKSPDGLEDWIIYHARDYSNSRPEARSARAQRFGWNSDGTPDFGKPIPSGVAIPVPSGEKSLKPAGF